MGRFRDALPGRHLMIDGETFSTGGQCVFVQLAATEFWPTDRTRPGRTWSAYININSSLRNGRVVDGDTLLWWLDDEKGAGPEARRALVRGMQSSIIWRAALTELIDFAVGPVGRGLGHRPEGVAGVWSHGAAFDVARIETAMADEGLDCPWDFRDQRDTRTLFQLAGSSLGKLGGETTLKHDAAADTVHQVRAVHAALSIMDGEA